MGSIAEELRQRIRGEVHFDPFTRALYSTDASIYRIDPLGVIAPRDEQDLATVITAATERQPPQSKGKARACSSFLRPYAGRITRSAYGQAQREIVTPNIRC